MTPKSKPTRMLNVRNLPEWVAQAIERKAARESRSYADQVRYILQAAAIRYLTAERKAESERETP